MELDGGNKIFKYDLRLTQPNQESIPKEELALLDYWLNEILPKFLPQMIQLAPKGSFTGFNLLALNVSSDKEVVNALSKTLFEMINIDDKLADNYELVKALAKRILTNRDHWLIENK